MKYPGESRLWIRRANPIFLFEYEWHFIPIVEAGQIIRWDSIESNTKDPDVCPQRFIKIYVESDRNPIVGMTLLDSVENFVSNFSVTR